MNMLLAMIPSFFWGTTYAATQYTLPDWPPLLLGTLRALPAGLILWFCKPSLPNKTQWAALGLIGLTNIGLFFSLIFVMALTLPSAISGVGMVSVPVFAMLYHWLFFKKQPSWLQIISGITLIFLAWQLFSPSNLTLNPIGLMAMLAAIVCIIYGSTRTQQLSGHIHWWDLVTWQLIIGGVILAIAALVHGLLQPEPYLLALTQFNLTSFLGLVWIIVLNTALGYGLYVWLLQRMSVVDFTFGSIANPIAGIVCGSLLLNEFYPLSQYMLMAGMIIMSLFPSLMQQLILRVKRLRRAKSALD